MIKITKIAVVLVLTCITFSGQAQEQKDKTLQQVAKLEKQKEAITQQEKKALKEEVKSINDRLQEGLISEEEAKILKEEVAKKRAMNIENRLAILDNQIALLQRNNGELMQLDTLNYGNAIELDWGTVRRDGERLFGLRYKKNPNMPKKVKYDRRTYSDFVMAVGLNNALIEGQSLDESPYKIGGSRFFEMGLQWRTRVFKNSNWLRFNYGFAFQFNGLKVDDNQYFVQNGNQTELQVFDEELTKSKFRMDNLVFPVHFEFGPSKVFRSEEKIRYSLRRQFRMGIGGYGGFNIGVRQKLKYRRDGERVKDKFKRGYNTSNLVYGLSTYAGFGNTTMYVKYDLNPIFKNATVEQRNISLGFRFDLD